MNDTAGITDWADVELNVDPVPDPDAKGPATGYVQQYEGPDGHTYRVVDRFGEPQGDGVSFEKRSEATKAAKAAAKEHGFEHESYPGASGGPAMSTEGDPE